MNLKDTGASKRPKLSPRYGEGSNDRMAQRFGAAAKLSQTELRQLVAAMVD
jgi:hypothetical protein